MSAEETTWGSWADVAGRLPQYTSLTASEAADVVAGLVTGVDGLGAVPYGGVFASVVVLLDPGSALHLKGEAAGNLMHLGAQATLRVADPVGEEQQQALLALVMMIVRELYNSEDTTVAVRALQALRPDPVRVREAIDYAEHLARESPDAIGALILRTARVLRRVVDDPAVPPDDGR